MSILHVDYALWPCEFYIWTSLQVWYWKSFLCSINHTTLPCLTEASSLPRNCFAVFIHQIAMQVVCSIALFLNFMQCSALLCCIHLSVLYKQCSALLCCIHLSQCQCYTSSVQHCLAVFDSVMQAVFGIALLFVISSYASSVRTTLPCCVCIGVMQAVYSIALLCWSTGLYLHLSYNGASGVQHCLAVCLLVCTFICRTVLQVVCRTALLFICRTA